ncbi:MAG: NAD(P)-dependent glycerol-3-phosphate dehydrogenase [bacterium]|nr:NAD(P)-dependent glycerol-3-phosphate dehydrogenase [bacterium]
MTRIAILGAGNWGTTMALVLQRGGHDVSLWEFDSVQAARVAETRVNEKFLPGHLIPGSFAITADVSRALKDADLCLLAVPLQSCRSVLRAMNRLAPGTLVVSLMKGIEQTSLKRASEMCAEELETFPPQSFSVLSGPTIAVEIAAGLPASAVIASISRETAARVQSEFSGESFRLYTSDDLIGVELAGAMKNVIALAAGMCDGMNLGANAKGALLTRGLTEITRLGVALGGNARTFSGLSGMGDLFTTCSSPASRNRSVGEALGRGENPLAILSRMTMVAEGVWTARAARDLSLRHQIAMPITEAVCRILDGDISPRRVLSELMTRDLKAED